MVDAKLPKINWVNLNENLIPSFGNELLLIEASACIARFHQKTHHQTVFGIHTVVTWVQTSQMGPNLVVFHEYYFIICSVLSHFYGGIVSKAGSTHATFNVRHQLISGKGQPYDRYTMFNLSKCIIFVTTGKLFAVKWDLCFIHMWRRIKGMDKWLFAGSVHYI